MQKVVLCALGQGGPICGWDSLQPVIWSFQLGAVKTTNGFSSNI